MIKLRKSPRLQRKKYKLNHNAYIKETYTGNKSNRSNLGVIKIPKGESSYRNGNNKEIIEKN